MKKTEIIDNVTNSSIISTDNLIKNVDNIIDIDKDIKYVSQINRPDAYELTLEEIKNSDMDPDEKIKLYAEAQDKYIMDQEKAVEIVNETRIKKLWCWVKGAAITGFTVLVTIGGYKMINSNKDDYPIEPIDINSDDVDLEYEYEDECKS